MNKNGFLFPAELVTPSGLLLHPCDAFLCLPPSAGLSLSRNRLEIHLDRAFRDCKLFSADLQDVIESRCLDCCLGFSEIPVF